MKKVIFLLAPWLLLASGCSNDDVTEPVMPDGADIVPAQFINEVTALNIAKGAVRELAGSESRASLMLTPIEVRTYPSASRASMGDDACYIINFAEGGYAVVSADARMPEVLAMDTEGRFSPEDNAGQEFFMELAFEYLPSRSLSQNGGLPGLIPFDSISVIEPAYVWHNGHRCGVGLRESGISLNIQPFITTRWHQNAPFNTFTPMFGTKNAPAGCAVIAVAQIMNYYKKPEYRESGEPYNWSQFHDYMDVFDYGTTYGDAIGRICKEFGISMNTEYSLEGSSTVLGNVVTFLKEKGYSDVVRYNGYDAVVIRENVELGYPVAVTANGVKTVTDSTGMKTTESTCHMWLIDGAFSNWSSIAYKNLDTGMHCYTDYDSKLYFHCNWGDGFSDKLTSIGTNEISDAGGYYLSGVFESNRTYNPGKKTNYRYNADFVLLYNIY
ncbi:MAG: C10 family peptidase [Muribaculaceae bacterium]|nr:C10 family peptidase [Muribaculaceae bacterium]